ncbi:uncharacterized protein PHACADRAFT_210652 [Phanerochaete carnosa HHB-10118-sp]|uniref:Uncharacterized protein n=1 Tax=Phanerochaete carnosa (strain HHB-10118-sp) TaxID=650164 RepID=K5UXR9_PHACS|nr:uncharacterized protein PHACADRAFT_210652 [Phanerochaete carnosa HHB-10118-sp]EKM54881.1 hypothetical protein PHACADRAFT_210652 [Phanerochaete carnosa HHB-10118-sp]
MCFPFLLAKDERRASRSSDIVHVHVLPVKRDDARRTEFYSQLLDHILTVSGVVAIIANGPLNIPFLKNAADLVKSIAELGQALNANKDDCDKLVQKTSDHLSILSDTLAKDNITIDAAFQSHVLSFVEIQYVFLNFTPRSYRARLLRNAADRREIVECQEQLSRAFDQLQLASIVHTAVRLNGIAHGVSDVETLVGRSTDDLRLQLSKVHRVVSAQSYPSAINSTRTEARRRRPRRPSSNLQISTNIIRSSPYRRISTPYTVLPLSPLRMQWTGTAITRAHDAGMLNLRSRRDATAVPKVRTAEREAR